MLWIALYLPNLPVEILTRGSPSPEPLAIAAGRTLIACDAKALARGARPGMTPQAALALVPQLDVRPRDMQEETETLLGLAAWAAQFTPNVALEVPDLLLLEVSGSLKLFGGFEHIVQRLRGDAAALGFTALVAVASTPRSASWLAHAGREAFVMEQALLRDALAPLPVRLAAPEPRTLEALLAVGVRTVGEIWALPRAGLARRFGAQLLLDLDRALGTVPDPRNYFVPPARFHARLELPAEVTQTEALLFAAQRLLVQLEGFLAARSGGVQRLVMRLFHAATSATAVSVGLVVPARDAAHFMLLLRERLATVVLRDPVRSLALAADDIVPLAGESLALFGDEHGTPGDWAKLVERLRARLGAAAVHGLTGADDHRPELASRPAEPALSRAAPSRTGARQAAPMVAPPATAPILPTGDRNMPGTAPGRRPLWLLPTPQPLAEIGAVPHHRGPLRLLAGPERIESGWWDGADVTRDYFIAQGEDQALVWIYRQRSPLEGWFLHGFFA